MDSEVEMQQPDEFRPTKRVKLDAPLSSTEGFQDEIDDADDWDDIYETSADATEAPQPVAGPEVISQSEAAASSDAVEPYGQNAADPSTIDGPSDIKPSIRNKDGDEQNSQAAQVGIDAEEEEAGVPFEAVDPGDELVDEQQPQVISTDGPSEQVLEETAEVETGAEAIPNPQDLNSIDRKDKPEQGSSFEAVVNDENADNSAQSSSHAENPAHITTTAINGVKAKPQDDPEFLEAAATQKENPEAEWQYDSSDAESSSDTSSDDSSDSESDSDSEDGYEMLDPATAAKMLLSGDGDDDDGEKGKNKSGGDHQPRTANEVKEEVIPRPDVVVTADMKITLLGTVDRTVDNMALVKAVTPGEYQVLESGSVLCKEDREVVGAVAETFGRVQEPKYSIAFTNEQELKDAGLEVGTKVFYVDSHSTFVFTQPLRNLKGTDASNIHDEEVGEDEIEFSDDEKEAEYKRMKKLAKRGGRGGLSRSAFMSGGHTPSVSDYDTGSQGFVHTSDAPQQEYGGGMRYDDEDGQDEFYKPLKRPDNLSQMMANGSSPRESPGFDRGRGRGRGEHRGRGRGDRGRGRGGFDRGRGGRGGHANRGNSANPNNHRGSAHSFPDRHNNDRSNDQKPHALPTKPNYPPSQPQPPHMPTSGQNHYQQAQAPQSYQFNGYTFQYGNQSQPPLQPPPQSSYAPNYYPQQQTSAQMPAGAYVNPSFFQGAPQQAQQAQWTQSQYNQQQVPRGAWPPQSQQPYPPQQAPQAVPPQQPNLADIMRQLNGQSQ